MVQGHGLRGSDPTFAYNDIIRFLSWIHFTDFQEHYLIQMAISWNDKVLLNFEEIDII